MKLRHAIDISKLVTLEQLNAMNKHTIMAPLGIAYTETGVNYLCGKMPVNENTKQPHGILHGGASCVLAESLGSIGSALIANPAKNSVTGIEINANHLKAIRKGFVYGKATIIHCGISTHVWEIEITDEDENLVCISRLTVMVIPKVEK